VYQQEEEYNGAVAVEIENAVKEKARIQREYGFETHGMVFLSADRGRVIDTLGGHLMTNEEIAAALSDVLASVQAASPDSTGG
jgi:hypothetical protein